MSNSPLVNYTCISPNKTTPRNNKIDRITPHCVVGQCSVETLGDIFAPTSRKASSNYGIGYDGRIGLYVNEKDRSWCSSSGANDHRSITIEIASDRSHPYTMYNKAYNAFLDLATDICKRHGKTKLLWISDKTTALNYVTKDNEMLLTVHRWFANTECPGDWLYNRLGDVAAEVTQRLSGNSNTVTCPKCKHSFTPGKTGQADVKKSVDEIAREVINGKWGNGDDRKNRLTAAGYNYSDIQKRVNELC